MNLSRLHTHLLLSILLVLSACNGTSPDDQVDEVKFSIGGFFDGEWIRYDAGVDNQYLFTSFELDSVSVYEYAGSIRNISCSSNSNCPSSLSIEIRDEKISANGESYHATTLTPGSFNFRAPVDSSLIGWQINYNTNEALGNSTNYTWSFDGASAEQYGSGASLFIPIQDAGLSPITTSLRNEQGGKADTLSYPIHFTSTSRVDFTYDIGPTQSNLTPQPEGQAPFIFRWDLGNGYMAPGQPPIFNPNPSDSTLRVCVEIRDGNNQVAEHCKHVILDSSIVYRLVNFHYRSEPVFQLNTEDLREVTITWTNPEGKTYSSDRFVQLAGSRFEITASSAYDKNEENQSTMEFSFNMNVVLFGDDYFDRVYLTESEGTWAIAHPD